MQGFICESLKRRGTNKLIVFSCLMPVICMLLYLYHCHNIVMMVCLLTINDKHDRNYMFSRILLGPPQNVLSSQDVIPLSYKVESV